MFLDVNISRLLVLHLGPSSRTSHLGAGLTFALRIRHNHSEADIWSLNQLLLVYQQAVQASLAHGGGYGCRRTFVLESQLPGGLELFSQSVHRDVMPLTVFGLQVCD